MSKKNVLILALALVIIVSLVFGLGGCAAEPVVEVGTKNFTEQFLLGWLTYHVLDDAGVPVNANINLGGTEVARSALEGGEIDTYWEYTGTAWMVIFEEEEEIVDEQEAYELVASRDLEENDLIWLEMAPFDNTYTLMMREEHAAEEGIETISELVEWIEEKQAAGETVSLAAEHEFMVREDGYPALQELYGFEFDDVKDMELGLTHVALRDGDVDVAMGFATDSKVAELDLVNLEDDQDFFPVYNPAPVIRADIADDIEGVEREEIEELLNQIGPLLDTDTIIELNYQVEVLEEDPEEVARQWLLEVGLISE